MSKYNFKASKSIQLAASKLIFDPTIYPRCEIDKGNISSLAEKLRMGIDLDPVAIEQGTNRIIDGVHRWKATTRVSGPSTSMKAMTFCYKSEIEARVHSAILNLHHGSRLNKQDLAMNVAKLSDGGLTDEDIGTALGLGEKTVSKLKSQWAWDGVNPPEVIREPAKEGEKVKREVIDLAAKIERKVFTGLDEKGERVFLKHGVRHLSGKTLKQGQVKAIDKLLGHEHAFLVRQVIMIIENDLYDSSDEELIEQFKKLGKLIGKTF